MGPSGEGWRVTASTLLTAVTEQYEWKAPNDLDCDELEKQINPDEKGHMLLHGPNEIGSYCVVLPARAFRGAPLEKLHVLQVLICFVCVSFPDILRYRWGATLVL
jgi:hypothetical protein